ncbi:hypothetical protein [Sphingomonas sp. G-3-2-10]|nr:hypothetical protein [Sphingomonas sp. G-3-2-10]NML08047.1 hypothetical protein [Sphingomonas sp. G-3-2-10]
MKLKEILRRIGRTVETIAHAADYDPLAELASRVDRLERTVADIRKP